MGFRATAQRHHMGISGIWSKQLRAPYGVSRARWVKLQLHDAILSATILLKLVDSYLITFKFAQ